MGSTRTRFLIVALTVSLFAIGMAAFLNYYKFKSTLAHTVESRIVVVGRGIEASLEASLALGIALADVDSAPGLLAREKLSDGAIVAIDVFDDAGRILYSTEADRTGRTVPSQWRRAYAGARGSSWRAEESGSFVAGIPVTNSFNLDVGHVALRYSRAEIDAVAAGVGREVALKGLVALAGVAAVLPLVLYLMMRRLLADLQGADAALEGMAAPGWQPPAAAAGSLTDAVAAAGRQLADAERELARLETKLGEAG